jgi:hypothetical protein
MDDIQIEITRIHSVCYEEKKDEKKEKKDEKKDEKKEAKPTDISS